MASPRTQTRYPNGTTQEESEDTDPVNHADPKRLMDTVRACTHTSSVGLTTFTRYGSGGFAPGFIVSHSQEKWKWIAGPDTRQPGYQSQVKRVVSKYKYGHHNQHRH